MRRCSRGLLAIAAAILLPLTAASAVAQTPPPASSSTQKPAAPVFKSSVDLVAVDVSVVDRNGNPITGLTPEQFEVTLDGKPRRVVSAEFLEFTSSAKTPGAPAVALPRRLYSSNDDPGSVKAPGRLIYLAVDQGSFRTLGAAGAMEAARKFIDRLQPADRIGLVAFPPPGPVVEASSDHGPALAATKQIIGGAEPLKAQAQGYNVSLAEAIDIRAGDTMTFDRVVSRECGGPGSGRSALDIQSCKQTIVMEAADIGQRATIQTSRSLAGLQGVIRALATIRERKTLVLISGGLPVADRAGGDLQLSGDVTTIAREAAAANLNLFVLHLDSSFLDAFSATEAGRMSDTLSRDMGMMSTGLDVLAGAGGGSLARIQTGADIAFDRVLKETAAAYILGVEPATGDRDGKSHLIRVKVNAPGAEARSRSEVTLPALAARPATPAEALAEVLRAPSVATGLPVRVATHMTAQESGSGLRVFMSAEIGEGITGPVDLQIGYVITDPTGRAFGTSTEKQRVTPRATSRNGAASYLFDGVLKPGKYVLRLAAIDAAGRAGSVDHPFTVGLVDGDGIRMADLLMLDPLRTKEEGVAPVTDGELWGQSIEVYLEFISKTDQNNKPTLELGIADRPGGEPLFSVRAAAESKDAKSPWGGAAHLDVSALPPGDYVAFATISAANRRLGRVERPLHIERRTASPSVGGGVDSGGPRVRFLAGESGSLVRTFVRDDLLRGEALTYFLGRLKMADAASAAEVPVINATAALQAGKFDEVLSSLGGASATKLSPAFLRGLALFGKGELEPAAAQFRTSLRISADFLPAAFYLGACYAAGGRDREAAGAWQTSLISEADARIVYDVLGDAWLRLKDGEQAASVLTEAREKWPDDESFVPRLAAAQVLLDRRMEALNLLGPYITRHPKDADAIFLAMRLLYDTHAAGGRVKTGAEDAATAREYSVLYKEAGGANAALVDRWAAFIARSK